MAEQTVRLAPGLSAAEVHAHTLASDGMVSPEELVAAAADAGIAVLCITDHDTLSCTPRTVEAALERGIEVVAGQEITTAGPSGTHVIGLFLQRPVRMGMSIEDTVDAIHDEGGLATLPHPFMPTFFASAGPRRITRLLDHRTVDGIELRHTAVMAPWAWQKLDAFYQEHRDGLGAALGAGDSHFGSNDLGRVLTAFPGRTAADLRRAIEDRTASPIRGFEPPGPRLATRLRQQRRSMIWLTGERRAGRVGRGVGPHQVRDH
jgi:predicted metal-dependent phosphoesterase TrpH